MAGQRCAAGLLEVSCYWKLIGGGGADAIYANVCVSPPKKFHISENKTNKQIRQRSAGRQLPRRCVSVGRDGSQK